MSSPRIMMETPMISATFLVVWTARRTLASARAPVKREMIRPVSANIMRDAKNILQTVSCQLLLISEIGTDTYSLIPLLSESQAAFLSAP